MQSTTFDNIKSYNVSTKVSCYHATVTSYPFSNFYTNDSSLNISEQFGTETGAAYLGRVVKPDKSASLI